jgi:alkylhydroperoxidase/carboxymuconolactone decarboxylase family protein YurZ
VTDDGNGRPEALIAEIEAKRGYIYPWQEYLAREDPDFVERYEALWDMIGARSLVLPASVKQLILIGVVCSRLDDVAMRTQIDRGLRMGITAQEIAEAIEVAFLPSGALTLVHGIKALVDGVAAQGTATAESGDKEVPD